jgi:hypothetical protein
MRSCPDRNHPRCIIAQLPARDRGRARALCTHKRANHTDMYQSSAEPHCHYIFPTARDSYRGAVEMHDSFQNIVMSMEKLFPRLSLGNCLTYHGLCNFLAYLSLYLILRMLCTITTVFSMRVVCRFMRIRWYDGLMTTSSWEGHRLMSARAWPRTFFI